MFYFKIIQNIWNTAISNPYYPAPVTDCGPIGEVGEDWPTGENPSCKDPTSTPKPTPKLTPRPTLLDLHPNHHQHQDQPLRPTRIPTVKPTDRPTPSPTDT